MNEEDVRSCYFVLTIYRVIDLCCDWYCYSHFKHPDQESTMLAMCVLGTVFSIYYLCRAMYITCGNGRISLPELNFNVIEVIVNVIQTALGSDIMSSNMKKGCSDSMNFRFACCCCCGSVLQLLCFFKNLCGGHGKKKQSDFDKIVNVIGLGGSLISANVGFLSIYDTFGKVLRSC